MRKHGKFSVKTEGQIVIAKLFGSFNELGAGALTDSLKKEVKSLNDLPFAELIDVQELEGVTPEGFEIIEEWNYWINIERKLIAKAFVTGSSVHPVIAQKNISSQKKQNVKIFDGREQALQWLREELLKAGNENP